MTAPMQDLPQTNEFQAMEKLDEDQMIDELQGHVIEQYFYKFSAGGKQVVGISWAGIKFVSRKMSEAGHGISVEDLRVEREEDGFVAYAAAMDVNTKEKRWGTSDAPYMMKLKDGGERENPFARQVAVSKAQRNAIRNFIPETTIIEALKQWQAKQSGGVQIPASQADRTSRVTVKLDPKHAFPMSKTSKGQLCNCGHSFAAHDRTGELPGDYVCAQCVRNGDQQNNDNCDLSRELFT